MCLSLGPLRSRCQDVIKSARILLEVPVREKIGRESDKAGVVVILPYKSGQNGSALRPCLLDH